ncbi:MAG: hypothetical protein JO000_30330, partial [Alphaproteobacteria bacterium]|nr:hypothetical protein [Alphaproteobacteria bacterium]
MTRTGRQCRERHALVSPAGDRCRDGAGMLNEPARCGMLGSARRKGLLMAASMEALKSDGADPLVRIARIATLVENAADRNEALGRLVPAVVDALQEQRLFRLLLPRVYGGEEIDLTTWFAALEALGRRDAS